MTLDQNDNGAYFSQFRHNADGSSYFQGTGTTSHFSYYDAFATNGTGSAIHAFNRTTNTTGANGLYLYKGNNTTTINTALVNNADSYINADNGNLGIGTATPGTFVDIENGDASLPTLTVEQTSTTNSGYVLNILSGNQSGFDLFGVVKSKKSTNTIGDGVGHTFWLEDSGTADQEYGFIGATIVDSVATTEDGAIVLATTENGTTRQIVAQFDHNQINFADYGQGNETGADDDYTLTVDASGNIQESVIAYGEMKVTSNQTITIEATPQWNTLTGWASENLKNFSATDSTLTYTAAESGNFIVNGTISFSGNTNETLVFRLDVQDVGQGACAKRKLGTGGDVGTIAVSGLVTLSQNDVLKIKVDNETSANDITVERANFVIHKLE